MYVCFVYQWSIMVPGVLYFSNNGKFLNDYLVNFKFLDGRSKISCDKAQQK